MRDVLIKALQGLTLGVFLCATPMAFADNAKGDPGTAKAPDNTGKNKAERQAGEPTAEQQKNNKSDLEVTRLIRRALVTDKTLSVYAHNVKIITQNGSVTLKGPVRSDQEKQVVEQKAVEVAGKANVKCELEVAPK